MKKQPRIAGGPVSPELVEKWYSKIRAPDVNHPSYDPEKDSRKNPELSREEAYFRDIEVFNANMVPSEGPLLRHTSWVKRQVGIKQESNTKAYYDAARRFLWEWPGWNRNFYRKKPFIKTVWEYHIDGYDYGIITSKILRAGIQTSGRSIRRYIKNLQEDLNKWVSDGTPLK